MNFSAILTALGLSWGSIALGLAVLPPAAATGWRWRAAVVWSLAAVTFFVVGSPGLVLTSSFVLLVVFAPGTPARRVAFYLAVVPFLPGSVAAAVPLPGANYLAFATPQKICTVVLLLPLLLIPKRAPPGTVGIPTGTILIGLGALRSVWPSVPAGHGDRAHLVMGALAGLLVMSVLSGLALLHVSVWTSTAIVLGGAAATWLLLALPFVVFGPRAPGLRLGVPSPGWFAVCYVLYTFAGYATVFDLTPSLRFLADQLLVFVIPFFAMTRALESEQDLYEALQGFLYAAAILAAVALLSTAKRWNFYTLGLPLTIDIIADYRWGFLRVLATTNTHSLGYHLAAAALLLVELRKRIPMSARRFAVLMAMLLAGMVLTGSRGAMLALAFASLVYAASVSRLRSARWGLLALCVVASAYAGIYLLSPRAAHTDAFGTIDYRQRLLEISIDKIELNPWFGDIEFLKSPLFDELLQGQGIVDITNYYLQVALQFGFVGLLLFVPIFALPSIGLARRLLVGGGSLRAVPPAGAGLLAAGLGWLVLVATTSDVGLVPYLGTSIAALGYSALRIGARQGTNLRPQPPRPAVRPPAFAAGAGGPAAI